MKDFIEELQGAKIKRMQIYRDHLQGISYSKLSRKYNLTVSRIGQIIARERKTDPAYEKKD